MIVRIKNQKITKEKKDLVKMPVTSATGKTKARAGDGLANEGTNVDYNEER